MWTTWPCPPLPYREGQLAQTVFWPVGGPEVGCAKLPRAGLRGIGQFVALWYFNGDVVRCIGACLQWIVGKRRVGRPLQSAPWPLTTDGHGCYEDCEQDVPLVPFTGEEHLACISWGTTAAQHNKAPKT